MVDDTNSQPAWEVVLRIDGFDVASATSFMEGSGKHRVLLSVWSPDTVRDAAVLLRQAAYMLEVSPDWEDFTGISPSGSDGNETRTLPF